MSSRAATAVEELHFEVPIMNLGPENEALLPEIAPRLEEVLRRGDFMLGDEVERFEEGFAAFQGARWAIAVNSGTDALTLSLEALGIGPGDEVITVANTFVATVGAILERGAAPRFVDVGHDENMDPERLAEAITPRTRAVIPVHLRGRPARMTEIMEIARRHGLQVVEDGAQAHGARYDGRPVGTFGAAGAFSLHPQKILGACGDAGVITTADPQLAARLRLLRHHGLRTRDMVETWGHNSRLDTMQAAILNVKLRYVEGWIERRRHLARRYIEALAGLPLELPVETARERCTYYLFTVQAERRDELQAWLQSRGVDARIHYPHPIYAQPAARQLGVDPAFLPVTHAQSRRILSLPIYPSLTEERLDAVAAAVRSFYGG